MAGRHADRRQLRKRKRDTLVGQKHKTTNQRAPTHRHGHVPASPARGTLPAFHRHAASLRPCARRTRHAWCQCRAQRAERIRAHRARAPPRHLSLCAHVGAAGSASHRHHQHACRRPGRRSAARKAHRRAEWPASQRARAASQRSRRPRPRARPRPAGWRWRSGFASAVVLVHVHAWMVSLQAGGPPRCSWSCGTVAPVRAPAPASKSVAARSLDWTAGKAMYSMNVTLPRAFGTR